MGVCKTRNTEFRKGGIVEEAKNEILAKLYILCWLFSAFALLTL